VQTVVDCVVYRKDLIDGGFVLTSCTKAYIGTARTGHGGRIEGSGSISAVLCNGGKRAAIYTCRGKCRRRRVFSGSPARVRSTLVSLERGRILACVRPRRWHFDHVWTIRPSLVIGVVVGTVTAGLLGERELLTSIFNGVCNAGQAVLVAWLLEWWFGRPFRFADLRRVAGFFAAAGLATAVSAIAGASIMTLLHTTAPYWEVWRAWFLSGGVGIVVVAPVIIGLGHMWREAPSQKEWIEGVGVLSLTALASFYAVSHKTGSWISFSPGGVVLLPLLWLTARCRPAFGLAGAFIASVSVILATTFGIGRFGDAAVPLLERVQGAQMAIVTVTVYTLVLIALFAQRKEAEDGLRESKELLAKERAMLARLHDVSSQLWLKRDLRQALDEILAGAIELLGANMGVFRILDPTRGVLKIEAHRGFTQEFIASFRECGR